MTSFYIFNLITFLLASITYAQHPLPVNDNDWAESNEKVFLRDEVANIIITMEEDDLDTIIADPYTDELRLCTVRYVNSVVDETVTDVGIRARGNSQRSSTKFPWKLEFNDPIEDRKFLGLEKMNLNSESVDVSMARATLAYDAFRSIGVACSRTAHVWLTINDGSKIQGVYNNVEQVDEEFNQAWFGNKGGDHYKCRWKESGASLEPLNPNTLESYEASEDYEEKTTGSYQFLFDFINFIADSSDDEFRSGIKDWMNVDSFLRAQAVDVAIGGWDGLWIYGNNYYLYHDEETGIFEYTPWDLDHTFGMDYWFFPFFFGTDFATKKIENWGASCAFGGCGDNGPPLIDRLMEIDEYFFMLKKYVKETTEKHLHPAVASGPTDRIINLLSPLAYTGSFSGSTMDGGFTNEQFLDSFENPESYSAFAVSTWGVMPFIRKRTEYIRDRYGDEESILPPIYVNEVVADNEAGITDENGQNEDWVELYNDSDISIDLSGFFLTDRYGNPRQWQIPDGTVIGPRDFLIFWCDNDEEDGPLHTNFKLSADGEGVYLYMNDPDLNLLVSSIVFPQLSEDQSYGRLPDGGEALSILNNPSPSLPNEPNELTLLVDGFLPDDLVISCIGASSNAAVIFIYSTTLSDFTIPDNNQKCGGTTLALSPTDGGSIEQLSDETGKVTLSVAGALVQPGVYIQVIDVDTCGTSNTFVL